MINSLMREPGDSIHYTSSFRNVIEDHLEWLRLQAGASVLEVTAIQAHKYEFDAAGLFNELGIPVYMHWAVARINGMKSLTEVPADLTQLVIPDVKDISRLASVHAMSLRL